MASRRIQLGPVGEAVRRKLTEIRNERRLTLRDVSERVTQAGRPLAHNTISEIERGGRRVDVDDLVALAGALGVRASYLLGEPHAPIYADARLMREFSRHTNEFFQRWERENPDPSPDEIADDLPDEFNSRD